MRRILLAVLGLLLARPAAAHAQRQLQPGVRYDFAFAALPLVGPSTGVDQGGFTAYLGADPLDAGESVRVQLFQNAFTEPPFYTHVFTTPTTLFGATVVSPVPWQDLQGTLSLTMLAGSVTLQRLQARAIRGGRLYEADVPLGASPPSTVPEPSALGLVLAGGALLAARRARVAPRR